MLVLALYDICAIDTPGKKRLRKVEKCCKRMGVPVQLSAYECELDWEQYLRFKEELSKMIDPKTDSMRFYCIGRHSTSIEQIGKSHINWNRETFVI